MCSFVVPQTKTGQERCAGCFFPCVNLSMAAQNLCQLALCDFTHREGSHTQKAHTHRKLTQHTQKAHTHTQKAHTQHRLLPQVCKGGREQPGAWEEKVRPPQKTLPVTLS